jgi:hypothetical protein
MQPLVPLLVFVVATAASHGRCRVTSATAVPLAFNIDQSHRTRHFVASIGGLANERTDVTNATFDAALCGMAGSAQGLS